MLDKTLAATPFENSDAADVFPLGAPVRRLVVSDGSYTSLVETLAPEESVFLLYIPAGADIRYMNVDQFQGYESFTDAFNDAFPLPAGQTGPFNVTEAWMNKVVFMNNAAENVTIKILPAAVAKPAA